MHKPDPGPFCGEQAWHKHHLVPKATHTLTVVGETRDLDLVDAAHGHRCVNWLHRLGS